MPTVSIAGLDRAEVLVALYSRAPVLGMGALQAKQGDLPLDEARDLIARHTFGSADSRHIYFDYLHGRCLKVDLGSDDIETRLYDRDAGAGMGERVIAALRARQPLPGQPTIAPPFPANPDAFADAHLLEIQVVPLRP